MITNQLITKTVIAFQNYLYQTAFFLERQQNGLLQEATSEFIKKELATLNLPIYPSSRNGFFAVLDSGKPGKTIAIRSGLDRHLDKNSPLSYSYNDSTFHYENQMKNISVMLATAHILKSWRTDLRGQVIFIFEDHEKEGLGVFKMVQSLSNWPIDAIYGTHLTEKLPVGSSSLSSGTVMRGSRRLSIDIMNDTNSEEYRHNAILAGTLLVSDLLTTFNNDVVNLAITQVNTPVNPGTVPKMIRIKGELSFIETDQGIQSLQQIKEQIATKSQTYDCQVNYGPDIETGINPVINDFELTQMLTKSLLDLKGNSVLTNPNLALKTTNSFTRYSELAPSVMSLIGAANVNTKETHRKYDNLTIQQLFRYSLETTLKFITDFILSK